MSNESQSPPLRLKPRLSPSQPATTPEPAAILPASPASPAAATPIAPLPPLPTLVAPPPLPTVVPQPLPPEPVPAPVSSAPVPPPSSEDPGKFKLKPRGAAASVAPASAAVASSVPEIPSAAVPPPVPQTAGVIPVLRLSTAVPGAAPAPAQPVAPGSVPIVKPTLPAAALASPAFAKPAAPAPGRPNMPIAPLPPSGPIAMPTGGVGPRPQGKLVAQNQEKDVARGKFALKLLLALLFVAACVMGIFAYNLWFAEAPAPEPVAVAKPMPPAVPATEASPVPEAVVPPPAAEESRPANPLVTDTPQSKLGQAVAQAQNAVKAHDAALAQPTNEVLNATPATTPPAAAVPAPVEIKPVPAPEPVVAPRPEPSANFKAFVVNLKINGVFQGENSRAMLNGKMYRLGDVVDAKLGIVFLRLEPEDKRIVFEDSKGAIMSRRY